MEDFPGQREGKKSIRDTVRKFSIDTLRSQASVPVSYTHLTLPTIYSV